MPRPYDRNVLAEAPESASSLRTGMTAAKLLAAAVAALLVSLLVIARSDAALVSRIGNEQNTFAPGVVEIDDDGGGLSMFDVDNLVPGRPVSECITVRYTGTVVPAVVRMTGDAEGALARDLLLKVEVGRGGDFRSCAGFRPQEVLYDGSLQGLPQARTADEAGPELFRPVSSPASRTMRFTADLREGSDPDGAKAVADFYWEATPD